MTSKERNEYLAKGMKQIKKPGKQAITFAKQKEKKGESVTVSEHDEDVKKFNKTLAESILLPFGSRGVFFEQAEDLCMNYNMDNRSCNAGCDKIGVNKGDRCPYQPVNTQTKCPCYLAKED